ncbi:MAG: fumarylacetoacetate hydrolase family protein [Zavarzinella sp.]
MRLCRFNADNVTQVGFYFDDLVVPIDPIEHELETHENCLVDFVNDPLIAQLFENILLSGRRTGIPTEDIELLVPIGSPRKIFLLAGNYAAHVVERGGIVAERDETFPYVFMKPPSTTLTAHGKPIIIPDIATVGVDWEIELAAVIGKRGKSIPTDLAAEHIAGYTIVNDITQRQFRPNPSRKKRERDTFFDWLHGKWFDTFCPCGPCLVRAKDISDPQSLEMTLTVNGEIQQHGSTGQMIFSVAEIISFISSMVTLEPGDIISTGTPAGVGSAKGKSLHPNDQVRATIAGIGTLANIVIGE